MNIGFIGVGLMGGPLARILIRAGYNVAVHDLNRSNVEKTLAAGKTGRAERYLDGIADCNVVFTSLPMPNNVRAVSSLPLGMYAFLRPGSIHVNLSTLDPVTAEALAAEAADRDIGFVQCSLGNEPDLWEQGKVPMFVGGDPLDIEKVIELLRVMGDPTMVGSLAAACVVKLISDLVGMANMAAMSEAMRMAEAAGLDRPQLMDILSRTGMAGPKTAERATRIATEDFTPRKSVDQGLRDVTVGVALARDWGLELPAMETAMDYLRRAVEEGHGDLDWTAVYKVVGQGDNLQ